MLIAGLAIALLIGIVSAYTISYFGQIQTTAKVKQAVLLDGKDYTQMPITEPCEVAGGETVCTVHSLQSQTSVPVTVLFETTFDPELVDAEIKVSYRKLPFEVLPHSDQNEINKANGHPYIEWTIGLNSITFNFVNPTAYHFAFDYRVDDEPGFLTEYSNIIIKEGELAGQQIGPSYHIVYTPPGENRTVTVTPCKKVAVGLRLGAEQAWFLDWIVFEAPELPTQITLQPGETLNFYICYEFAVNIYPGIYTITTTVKPAS
jgi:hypothetical protein